MQGVTGSFSVNGVTLLMQPTEHSWVDRTNLGISGDARPTYPSVRQYQLSWNFMSMEEFAQLHSFFEYSQHSGTLVVDLPKYATTPYQFYSYSGCTMEEPKAGKFFESYASDVNLLILKVRTQ